MVAYAIIVFSWGGREILATHLSATGIADGSALLGLCGLTAILSCVKSTKFEGFYMERVTTFFGIMSVYSTILLLSYGWCVVAAILYLLSGEIMTALLLAFSTVTMTALLTDAVKKLKM